MKLNNKMVKDYKGDPASVLLDILDPEQNTMFIDNYVEEPFDLSNVMFILTANYEESIPEALYDRLEIIELSSYTEFEKLDIAKEYLIPRMSLKYNVNNKRKNVLIIAHEFFLLNLLHHLLNQMLFQILDFL